MNPGRITPLMLAAATGNTAAVLELIEVGEDVNAIGPRGSTALMFAAGSGHFEIVKLLVQRQADIRAREQGGWTALEHAADDGHTEIVEFLGELDISGISANDDSSRYFSNYLGNAANVK